jgi:hypothetical protein
MNNHFFQISDDLFIAFESQMDAFEAVLSILSDDIQVLSAQVADYQEKKAIHVAEYQKMQANEERQLLELEKTLCLASPSEIRIRKLAQEHHTYTSMQRKLAASPAALSCLETSMQRKLAVSPAALSTPAHLSDASPSLASAAGNSAPVVICSSGPSLNKIMQVSGSELRGTPPTHTQPHTTTRRWMPSG